MLWGFDEARARRLLEEAFQAIANVRTDERGRPMALSYTVRNVAIRAIATRDPAMALRLQQSVEIPSDIDPKITGIGMANSLYAERARIQNDLAMYILMGEIRSGDLRHASEALKPFADRGDLQRLIPFARQIRMKDAPAADEIFSQALAKARLGQPSFDGIRHLTGYVFPNFGEGVFRYSEKKGDPFEATSISAELLEQFLDLAYNALTVRLDAALANTEGARLNVRSFLDYSLPKVFAPYFDRFMPERAAALRARVAESARRVPPEEQPYLALSEPGFEGLVSIADKLTDARTKDALYQNAASRAKYSGDLDRASAIIEKISNEIFRASQREELRREIDNHLIQETYKAFGAKDLDKAEKLIAEITDPRQRLQIFGSLIGGWFQKDKTRAISMLDVAERRVSGIENPIERAWQLKMLAGIAARVDRSRGFEKMGLAIQEFNGAGFSPEWEKYQVIETPAGVTSKNLYSGVSGLLEDGDFRWLGQTDLDRALTLAEEFHLREASALAQLAACRGMLSRVQPQKPLVTEKQKDAEKKALAQLDKISEMSKSFEDAAVRIRTQAHIADLLWTRDETRARRLFEKAFQATATAPLPAADGSMPPSYIGANSHYPLRNDLIRLVSQRDPVLALKLIDSVVDPPPNIDQKFVNSGYGNYSEQDMLRFQFALYVAQSEPQRAAQIASQLIQRGDIGRTLSIIDALRRNEQTLADDLFARAFSRMKQTNAASRESIGLLANYIFPGFGEGVLRFTSGLRRQGASESNVVSPALRDQFLDLALGAVMQWIDVRQQSGVAPAQGKPNETSDLTIAKLLLPYFDEHLPQKSAGVRARLEAVRSAESDLSKNRARTVEGLPGNAERTNGNEIDRVSWEAMMRALQAGNVDQASAILPKVRDERMRAQLELAVRRAREQELQERARVALTAGDFDTAYRLINEVSDRSQRVLMLGNMAVQLSYKNDIVRASQVLSVQEQLISKAEDPTERAQELIRFAGVAARIDLERGFEAARLVVEALNGSSIGPQWVKVENVTDDTGRTTSRRHVGLQLLASFLFDNTFSELARSDFDRALRLAQALEMKEASAFAQLGVCRGVLK
jgi:hypothetical protein